MDKVLYELTNPQKNIWNVEQYYQNTAINNIGGYININQKVNFDLLKDAANLYIKLNDSARLHFIVENSVSKQFFSNYVPFEIDLIEVKNVQELQELNCRLLNTSFNITDSDLFKFTMYKFSNGNGGLIGIFHHLIGDAWTMGLVISRIMDIYSSLLHEKSDFEEFPSYEKYVIDASSYATSSKFEKDKKFWDSVFDEEPELTHIYTDSQSSNDNVFDGAREVCKINKKLYSQILDYCKKYNCSVYTFFLAIFSLYLAKINDTNSAIIGTPVLNRLNFKEKQIAGMFVSNIPFSVKIDYTLNFNKFLKKVASNQSSMYRHQKYPYLQLLEDIKKKYDLNDNLYDFVLSYQNIRDNKNTCDVNYNSDWITNNNVANSIEAHFYDMDNTGDGTIYYNYQTAKFSKDDIKEINSIIMQMAKQALNDAVLSDIVVITPEQQKFINDFNNTKYRYNKNESIIDIFEKQVRKNRKHPAVIFKGDSISYDELDKKSTQVANMLLKNEITKKDVVGIMFNRSFDLLISMLGVLKIGASYMLIDPSLPEDRINYMLDDAACPLVLTNLFLNHKTLSLTEINKFDIKMKKVTSSNNDRLSIIYTSGSTGTPKGVELKRLSLINLVNSFKVLLHTNKCERFLSTSTVAFDMFMVENFLAILSGKTIVLANEEEQKIPAFTSKLILKESVDFIVSTPSKIKLLIDEDCLKNIKVIQLGGEVFKPSLYKALKEATNAEIHNGYGPSECCACSSDQTITSEDYITIGKPYLNVQMYIMNRQNNILPIGTPGELVIKGDGVGLGYINKSKFNGEYRTGDIAKLDKNGNLIYCGRKDNQIKFHGLRIELDEITNKIMELDFARNAITVIRKVNGFDAICTYIETENNEVEETKIRKILSKELPAYMVPSHIILIEKLPITLNGKIDSKNLPEIIVDNSEFTKSESNTEKTLEKIWCNVLNIKKISTTSNFFDIGGDSLSSIRVVSELYSRLNIKIDVRDIFEHPTIKELAEFIDTIEIDENFQKIKKHKILDFYPVSSAQRRIYYTVNMNENDLSYNTPFGILYDKTPDIKKLEGCLNTIINRHEAFRTYFEHENEDVVQKVKESIKFNLTVNKFKNEEFIKPFDLSKAPLIHAELDLYDDKALLQLDIHHIICDGTSMRVFAKELCDLYNGKDLSNLKYDYIDYTTNEIINNDDKEYWISQFKDNVPLLNMLTEYERTSVKSQEGNSIYDSLNNYTKINELCKKYSITPYMFLLAAYYVLLYKYTMQNDIVIGTPVVGRDNPAFANVIGMFVNTLALRQNVQSSNTFSDFVQLVRDNCLNAFKHQNYPFDELIKNVDITRDNSRSPLFDVMFIYESEGLPKLSLNDLEVSYIIPDNKTSKFDFSLEITPSDNSYNIRLEYSSKLYSKKFMETLLDCYKNIIASVIENNDIQISKIKMVNDVPQYNTALDYPKELRIIDLFEKQASKTPNNIALVFEDETYTYKELEKKVNRLANHIIHSNAYKKNGAKIIGIMMNRRAELIISQLAILKAGAGYVPIDPTYPEDRIKYIVEDSGINLILTEENLADSVSCNTIMVDDENSYDRYASFDTPTKPSDLAYMIYTSGSTGKPKGVMIKQDNVVNFIYGVIKDIPFDRKTIVSITTMCFDIFVLESLLPLCTGMKVVLASNEEQNNPLLLNKLCLKHKVKVIQTTPSKFKFLISESQEYIKNIEFILIGGEPFPSDLLKKIKSITDARIFNMYGPTETTVWSTIKELTDEKNISIGKPIANTDIYILDNDMNPVPYNVPGTLYIGGDGVTVGYWNKQELTSEKYIEYNGSRIYNSGDLAKTLRNGDICCLGRSDFQVKIRGLRIELGEIESAIMAYPGISESVVTIKNVDGRDILCGYFVASGRISLSLLKNRLSKKLPNYMIPVYLTQLDSFSYTPNGKIDRKNLPTPIFKKKEIVKPKTPMEKRLLHMWKSILSINEISTEDNFFDIGGDSLCALKLQLELMKSGYNINYGDIFKNNTICDLAEFIENNDNAAPLTLYKNRDFRNINKFIKHNNNLKRIQLAEKNIGDVLLVGATGFLGIHVLAELLKIDEIKIYCLIRKDPSTSPENKLKNKFKYYFGSDLSNLFGSRLFVLDGDITYDSFNLSSEQYEVLGNNVSCVINCAALVKHYGNYSDFERINVNGVKNVISFCEKFDNIFFQTSTISVSGNTMTGLPSSYNPRRKIYFRERDLFIHQPLDNVYVRSKFEAEKLVLEELANNKLKGLVLRIGNITNRVYDGKFQENSEENAFLNRMKAFLNLKLIPQSMLDKYVEFTPVDKLAESIVLSMKYYKYPISILHLYNSNHVYISELYDILKDLGINLKIVDDEKFNTTLNKWLRNNSKSDKVSVLINDMNTNGDLVYKTNLVIKNEFTLKFLNKANFNWTKIDKDYIKKVIKNL